MRQRLVFDSFVDCILTDEPEGVVGRAVVFGPSREMPRSWANWQRHKACLVAAPAMADLLEEIRAALESEFSNVDGRPYINHDADEAIAEIFVRPEVVAMLESIKQ